MAELTIDLPSEGDRTFYSACCMSVWVTPCVPAPGVKCSPSGVFQSHLHQGVFVPHQHPHTSFRCHLNSESFWFTNHCNCSLWSLCHSSLPVELHCTTSSTLGFLLCFSVVSGELPVSKRSSPLICPVVINNPPDYLWFLRCNFQITWLSWVLVVERCFWLGMTSSELPNNPSLNYLQV